jgi:hypothetical protein
MDDQRRQSRRLCLALKPSAPPYSCRNWWGNTPRSRRNNDLSFTTLPSSQFACERAAFYTKPVLHAAPHRPMHCNVFFELSIYDLAR